MGEAGTAVRRLRQELIRLSAEIVNEVGDLYRTSLLDAARSDTGGDLRLSGVTWMRSELDVHVAKATDSATLTPAPAHGGAAIWSWLENGTQPHEVGIGTSRDGNRRRMNIGGNWVTGPLMVRGSPAKRTWTRGTDTALPKAITLAERLFERKISG